VGASSEGGVGALSTGEGAPAGRGCVGGVRAALSMHT
jgi:hypothetical protein